MSQPTQQYKRSFSGSVGAGMKSVFGGDGRRYYVLEHRVSSAYHKAGESQKIIVDQVELGRDPKCQVRFDESFQTVSRRHAAIVKDGDNWKLIQLSHTNSTYLNGTKVQSEWYLQSGDEIQLSTNGPKLGFIVPQGDKSLVKSIGLTARLSLFRQQALLPYKRALAVLSCLFVLAIGIGSYFLIDGYRERIRLEGVVAEQKAEFDKENLRNRKVLDSLKIENADIKDRLKRLGETNGTKPAPVVPALIEGSDPYVYYIYTVKCDIVTPDGRSFTMDCSKGEAPGWTGTGFLLDDGRFVTARHVTEGWFFWASGGEVNEGLLLLNMLVNAGAEVNYTFRAMSSSGDQFTFESRQCHVDRSHDEYGYKDGDKISLATPDACDFSYVNIRKSGGLPYDARLSKNLKRGTELTVLGFPLSLGTSAQGVKPLYGKAISASEGLDSRGVIVTTDTDFEKGSSGGPVFCEKDGKQVVVGIVSAGAGRATGFVVPISMIN